MAPERDDPLGLDPETMRALGYRTVDMLVAQLAAVGDGPALRRAPPAAMRERLPSPPHEPRGFEALLEELERDVLPYMSRCHHPGYFAFIRVRDVPGGAGRLHRQRAQHLRRLVDGGGRAEPDRTARARAVQAVDRLSGCGGRVAGQRRIDRADSVTLHPHKWLYQPFECGCVLVRDGDRLRSAFEVVPDYLKDAAARAGEVNFSDLGFQLTRASRALKVWLSLGYFGVDAFQAAIDRSLGLAEKLRATARERMRRM